MYGIEDFKAKYYAAKVKKLKQQTTKSASKTLKSNNDIEVESNMDLVWKKDGMAWRAITTKYVNTVNKHVLYA